MRGVALAGLAACALAGLAACALGCGRAPVCSSGTVWHLGDQQSPVMHPGQACDACHALHPQTTTQFPIAGTVYAGPHDDDDCFGLGGATVVITDANKVDYTVRSNVSGNFSLDDTVGPIALPYSAKIVVNGAERRMLDTQMDGDCNGCHTASGSSGAPGRIQAP